mgnify:FL=1
MNKKVKSVIAILIIFIGFVFFTVGIVFSMKNKTNNTTDKKMLTEITQLLKNDYLITIAVFGKVKTDEANVVIDNIRYDIVIQKELSSIKDLHSLIYNTYIDDTLELYLLELDKYNKYVEIENNLYVNVNSLCTYYF